MRKKWLPLLLLALLATVLLTACAPGDGHATPDNPAGFLWGVWHGWIAPVSVIIGFFNPNIRVYEVYNTGHWYDVGFYIALIGGFGGLALTRRKKVEKHEHHAHHHEDR